MAIGSLKISNSIEPFVVFECLSKVLAFFENESSRLYLVLLKTGIVILHFKNSLCKIVSFLIRKDCRKGSLLNI